LGKKKKKDFPLRSAQTSYGFELGGRTLLVSKVGEEGKDRLSSFWKEVQLKPAIKKGGLVATKERKALAVVLVGKKCAPNSI